MNSIVSYEHIVMLFRAVFSLFGVLQHSAYIDLIIDGFLKALK